MWARSAVWAVVWAMVVAGCQGGIGSAAGPAEKAPGRSGAEATPTPKPTPAPIVLEPGTPLVMALETTVSTASAKPGDIVLARLLEPVRRGEKVLVPEGAEVRGKVTTAVRPGKVKGRARLVVDFERLTVDGRPHEIAASAIDITASNSKKRDAALIGRGGRRGRDHRRHRRRRQRRRDRRAHRRGRGNGRSAHDPRQRRRASRGQPGQGEAEPGAAPARLSAGDSFSLREGPGEAAPWPPAARRALPWLRSPTRRAPG
jgi:hypothetical protein